MCIRDSQNAPQGDQPSSWDFLGPENCSQLYAVALSLLGGAVLKLARQQKIEVRPPPGFARTGNAAPVRDDDLPGDGQPQTGALLVLPGYAIKLFEDVGHARRRNPRAAVADSEFDEAVGGRSGVQRDFALWRRVLALSLIHISEPTR